MKTIDALTKNAGTDTLIAAGEVVELRFRDSAKALSLRSAKLFHLLIDHAGTKACEDVEHCVPIAGLNFSHVDAEELVECVRDLIGTLVELTYKDGKGGLRTKYGPLLSDVDRHHDYTNGDLAYRFSPTLRLVLENSNHWAALSRSAVLAFESRYSLRLYELMTLRGGLTRKNTEIFDLDDLRRRLGVPDGKLADWSNFRKFALERAIAEVNQLSGLEVSYEAVKRGRRVAHVTLHWTQRDTTGRSKVALELANSRVGRRARRDGTAEIATLPPALTRNRCDFPTHGGLKHGQETSPWRELAESRVKRLSGGHTPDLNVLANEFRAFCTRKKIPLDAASIEKVFVSFCEKYNPPA